jgi:hypothetical protein
VEAERIASLVWRIAFGEGYSLDEWAGLLESLTLLSPWECVWRFQELAEKGLRRGHNVEPVRVSDKGYYVAHANSYPHDKNNARLRALQHTL